jgi:hypothetical protein
MHWGSAKKKALALEVGWGLAAEPGRLVPQAHSRVTKHLDPAIGFMSSAASIMPCCAGHRSFSRSKENTQHIAGSHLFWEALS